MFNFKAEKAVSTNPRARTFGHTEIRGCECWNIPQPFSQLVSEQRLTTQPLISSQHSFSTPVTDLRRLVSSPFQVQPAPIFVVVATVAIRPTFDGFTPVCKLCSLQFGYAARRGYRRPTALVS